MAVRVKARSSDLYEQDLHAWSEVQADLLRRRRFADLDLEHVVEKIEDVGGSLYREVRSRIRTVMEHLLKLEHSAITEPRAGRERTIRRERADLVEDLRSSLRARIERGLARFYEAALIEAAAALRAHGEHAAADAIPTTSPYPLDQITGEWVPEPSSRKGSEERSLTPFPLEPDEAMSNLDAARSAEIEIHLFEDDGTIPNNRELPLILYRSALDFAGRDPAELCEEVFAAQGWGGAWRDGIYPFPHYHSTAHEVLGIARGRARVRLGGERGAEVTLGPGDVVVIPAGVGHQNLGSGPDLLVIGAYPRGQRWDLCRGEPDERPRVLDNIARVPLPEADPVYGEAGPLIGHWRKRA